MTGALDSARYVLARAQQHTADLEREGKAFVESRPYVIVMEPNPKTNEKICKIKLVKPLPGMLQGIAKDAISNLRDALDHAGYAVAIAVQRNGKNAHFPFGDTEAEVKNRKTGGSNDLPDEVFALMAAFKPYLGGDDLLWSLGKLSNTNKHRLIVPMFAEVNGAFLKELEIRKSVGPTASVYYPAWDSKKNEMPIARMPADAYFKANIQISPFVAFGEVEPVRGLPATAVLDALAGKVDSILMAVEAEARRIGLFA